jgi:hypothetical protein
MTTFPLTLWMGSITTATALGFKASKLCMSTLKMLHITGVLSHFKEYSISAFVEKEEYIRNTLFQ